jgi:integrase/recombinase XerD
MTPSLHMELRPKKAAIDTFIDSMKAAARSEHTTRAYIADLKTVSLILDDQLGRTATTADLTVRELRKAMGTFAEGRAKSTIMRCWSSWNRFTVFLVKEEILGENIMAEIPHPKVRGRGQPYALSDAQSAELRRVVREGKIGGSAAWVARDYALICVLAATGLRADECIQLRMRSLDGVAGARWVQVAHGKGDSSRTVPLDPRIEPIIERYLEQRWRRPAGRRTARIPSDIWNAFSDDEPLWVTNGNGKYTYAMLAYMTLRAFRAAGIEKQRKPGALIHALRHSFATSLVENGVSARELMDLLGHESMATTQRYVSTRPDLLRYAVAANPALNDL